jgi:hypothetical protein
MEMMLNEQTSLYDILDLKPDASPQEVREAYLRTKAAYNKDSVALYTLISTDEREEMLSRIEEAYDILSNVDKRKSYDRNHGLLNFDDEAGAPSRVPLNHKIISIDRVPPMESSANSENLLVAPSTDFTGREGISSQPGGVAASASSHDSPPLSSLQSPDPGAQKKTVRAQEVALAQEITQEVEWKGVFLRKVREGRRISIEEMASITKVSKTYLMAIEEENFPKLPAAVFLRGFVTQIAKVLKLPHDAVAAAYMARYYQARPDKNAK